MFVNYRPYYRLIFTANPDKKLELHLKFKKFRNSIVAITRTCKEDYYKDYFETSKKDAKKIWNALKNLTNITIFFKTAKQITPKINEKITTDKIIANHFNYSFTSIVGKDSRSNIEFSLLLNPFMTEAVII